MGLTIRMMQGRRSETRTIHIWIALVAAATVLFIWWPLDLSLPTRSDLAARINGIGESPLTFEARDVVVNVLVFLPLGWVAARRRYPLRRVAGLGLGISVIAELGQLFQADRIVSVFDLAANTAGAVIGLVSVFLAHRILGFAHRHKPNVAILALCVLVLAVAPLALLQPRFASLAGWSPDYSLQLGNEATGDRPWCGQVLSFQIAAADRTWRRESFRFREFREHEISNANCANQEWWQTANPPADMVATVERTRRIRIEIIAQTEFSPQVGPARILSLSSNPTHRNFTIAQADSGVEVRVRRWLSGTNGMSPYYRIPAVFTSEGAKLIQVQLEAGPDSTVISADGRVLVDHHDITRQWWILLLRTYRWRDTRLHLLASFVWWLALLGPLGVMAGSVAAAQEHGSLRVAAWGAVSGGIGWVALTALDISLGWESALWMPLVLILTGFWGGRKIICEPIGAEPPSR